MMWALTSSPSSASHSSVVTTPVARRWEWCSDILEGLQPRSVRIVGVARDARYDRMIGVGVDLRVSQTEMIYLPFSHMGDRTRIATMIVRSDLSPATVIQQFRRVVSSTTGRDAGATRYNRRRVVGCPRIARAFFRGACNGIRRARGVACRDRCPRRARISSCAAHGSKSACAWRSALSAGTLFFSS